MKMPEWTKLDLDAAEKIQFVETKIQKKLVRMIYPIYSDI